MSERHVLRSHTRNAIHESITKRPKHTKQQLKKYSPPLIAAESPGAQLLSLPLEIRNKIYRTVIETDFVLMFNPHWHHLPSEWPPAPITTLPTCFCSVSIPPTHNPRECISEYQVKQGRTEVPGALSWLRTNRQIYTEAKSIVYENLNIHVADQTVLAALLFPPDSPVFKFSDIRSISVCLPMRITSDQSEGFFFAEVSKLYGWWDRFHVPGCRCYVCNIFNSNEESGDTLNRLRELNLQISFVCMNGNSRPVIGHFANGRPRFGKLNRLKTSSRLMYTGGTDNIDMLADSFCKYRPMTCFKGRYGKGVTLTMSVRTAQVEHDPGNICQQPGDRGCWCTGKGIDEESFRSTQLLDKIREKLQGETVEVLKSAKNIRT